MTWALKTVLLNYQMLPMLTIRRHEDGLPDRDTPELGKREKVSRDRSCEGFE